MIYNRVCNHILINDPPGKWRAGYIPGNAQGRIPGARLPRLEGRRQQGLMGNHKDATPRCAQDPRHDEGRRCGVLPPPHHPRKRSEQKSGLPQESLLPLCELTLQINRYQGHLQRATRPGDPVLRWQEVFPHERY